METFVLPWISAMLMTPIATSCVDGEFAVGDLDSADALVADPQDALGVGGDQQVHGPRQTTARVRARGRAVLSSPTINRGTAFTLTEREQLGLTGLLPTGVPGSSTAPATPGPAATRPAATPTRKDPTPPPR